jgi:hypothetical protein
MGWGHRIFFMFGWEVSINVKGQRQQIWDESILKKTTDELIPSSC